MHVTLHKETFVSPKAVALSTVIETMRSEAKKGVVTAYRKRLQDYDDVKYPEAKMPPWVLYSALFGKERGKAAVMKAYTGIVLVEVDNLAGEEEVARIRRRASDSLQTLAAFTGLSGRSVKILIRFALPGHDLPQTKAEAEHFHAYAYRQAASFYRMQLGREVTLKPPVVDRRCRLSYDPDLYYNPDALVVTMKQPLQEPSESTWEEVKQAASDPLERLLPGMERQRRLSFLFSTSLKETLRHFGGFYPDDSLAFLIRLAENCVRSGIAEADTVAWAMRHAALHEREREVREAVSNVYLLEAPAAMKPCLPQVQVLSIQLEHFMNRHYEFRRNELKKEVEYRKRGSLSIHFRPVTDEVLNSISLEAHAEGLNFWDRDVKRYVYSERIPLHNPIDFYLEHLPAWDGTDHIRALSRTLPTKNRLWPDFFYRWFLGMVAQWQQRNRAHAHSVLPLLTGEQGCGKSTWCRQLMPSELRDYYTDSIDFGSKREAELALHRFALINLDEFDSIGLGYQPFLKHLIQKPEINARRPYKNSVRALKRYGVFIATCNNMDLLTDPTGSRRFLCIAIEGRIDRHLLIDYEQLYAQAVAVLNQSERHWFNSDEEQLIVSNNKPFEQAPVEEQLLLQYFLPAGAGEEGGEWMSSIRIIQYLQERGKVKFGNLHVQRFGRILRKHNFSVKHTNQGNLYYIKER
ncbi:MAG: DUF3874 domain-containing protein [Tannerellaceae bacterium]|jgi:hypothetical protein|nr:DUF3874 domain-containing protein [Tannerellaceae bacterium]